MDDAPKRILIVDDSAVMCQQIAQLISADPQLTVAGVAHDGREAIRMVSQLKPDVVTMDIVMPVMDGLEATKQLMAYSPLPIVIVASSVVEHGRDLAFEALSYGALDVIEKKDIQAGPDGLAQSIDLAAHLKALATVDVVAHPLAKFERLRQHPSRHENAADRKTIVALAASTGGPQALLTILKELREDFPCGLLIVQHISPGFAQGLVDWLDRECAISVKLAVDGHPIDAGTAYVAPTGRQLRLHRDGRIRLTDESACGGHKPSATILFESVAEVYGHRAVGVILTGMGADGAAGLQKLHAVSGAVIAQDERTSIVFGMPEAAIRLGVADWVLPLSQIAGRLTKIVKASPRSLT